MLYCTYLCQLSAIIILTQYVAIFVDSNYDCIWFYNIILKIVNIGNLNFKVMGLDSNIISIKFFFLNNQHL